MSIKKENTETRKFYDKDLIRRRITTAKKLCKKLCGILSAASENTAAEWLPINLIEHRREIADSISFSFEIHSFTKEEYTRVQSVLFKLGYQWQSNRAYHRYNKIYRKLPCKTTPDGYVTCKRKTVLVSDSFLTYSQDYHWHYSDHFCEYNALMHFLVREFGLGIIENGKIKRLSRPDI